MSSSTFSYRLTSPTCCRLNHSCITQGEVGPVSMMVATEFSWKLAFASGLRIPRLCSRRDSLPTDSFDQSIHIYASFYPFLLSLIRIVRYGFLQGGTPETQQTAKQHSVDLLQLPFTFSDASSWTYSSTRHPLKERRRYHHTTSPSCDLMLISWGHGSLDRRPRNSPKLTIWS